MDRITSLEKEHVEVHQKLLKVLDQLYLKKNGLSTNLNRGEETRLENRLQLQLSLEKSGAILRTIERTFNTENSSADIDFDDFTELKPEVTSSVEHFLALRLATIMKQNYELDKMLSETLKKDLESYQELYSEHQNYRNLMQKFISLSSSLEAKKTSDDLTNEDTESDTKLALENETIEQLILALKVNGGYNI
ncbi:hypothetical protein Kpol_1028p97 [Vanderwaltozyma polyspora DSM 70294]|uniref:Uncharacterized protein n=1 Tax=Vanderwaltozyma polyspora (strain ATCC 22028 / DSM 70294 / BCRC 21397 / CBS 2163 / NBRC 10782 / NRRL Y-8283 / UCD 57-17) TaxID=436907 RepID=A7TG64_VANPO|nr:uncharacterized protein Kpol_1028p97 [Vanderwaltozyma polyspora DSM 70294]EDO18821.1 hypothetical protein Kpol_1028p97 [Vanderwaltozyma polyspora DSM 70294]